MNTVPMKARKSNSSWSGQSGGGLGPSLRKMQQGAKGAHRRFIFSITLFVFTVAGLVVGSFGGVVHEASARDNFRMGYYLMQLTDRFNQNQDRNTQQVAPTTTTERQTTNQQQVPAQTTQTAPSAPSTPAAESTTPAAPVNTAYSTSQITAVASAEPASPPVNTATDITTMTTAQASAGAQPVVYTSNQISTETRNRLLALAVSAVTSGSLIFIMSLIGTGGASVAPAMVRNRRSVSEVLPN